MIQVSPTTMANTNGSTDDKKRKQVQKVNQANTLETLKDLGSGVTKSVKEDLLAPMSKDFFNQLFKSRMSQKSYNGEIRPGEEVKMNSVLSGQREKEEKLRAQVSMERRLREEDQAVFMQKSQELKVQLQAIMQEVQAIAQATPKLAQELQIAAMQAPVNPGVYHVRFFEKMLDFMKAFRKNANEASAWLHAVNSRGKKGGNVWGNNYKKGKGSYLLSAEHYLQRSAG
jgi:hypothetical protein